MSLQSLGNPKEYIIWSIESVELQMWEVSPNASLEDIMGYTEATGTVSVTEMFLSAGAPIINHLSHRVA